MLRWFIGTVFACGFLSSAAPVSAEASKTVALVIGIDEYEHISDLSGAVNDAVDIAEAVKALPNSEVTMLLNEDATREAILSTWRKKATTLNPGDTFIITYAGHGGHEPEAYQGNEADGRDETLLLGGFLNAGEAAQHRIRDDEIADLIALVPPSVSLIFLADSCHSGTVVRSTRPIHGYRYFAGGQIVDAPLPPPPPNTRPDEDVSPNTVFLSAVADNEMTPEFLVDGEIRGALSLSFADALRGNADRNQDGVLTKGELETHVRQTIKSISQGIQNPKIEPVGRQATSLVSMKITPVQTPEPISEKNPFARAFDDLDVPSIWSDSELLRGVTGASVAGSQTSADLIVDRENNVVLSSIGDVLTRLPSDDVKAQRHVQGIVNRQRFIDEVDRVDRLHPLTVFFEGGNGNYLDGDRVIVHVSGRETEFVWLVHLSSTLEISHMFPLARLQDPPKSDPSNSLAIPMRVVPPFGADTILAIEAGGAIPELDQLLSQFDQETDIAGFWNELHALLGDREDISASSSSFFTMLP